MNSANNLQLGVILLTGGIGFASFGPKKVKCRPATHCFVVEVLLLLYDVICEGLYVMGWKNVTKDSQAELAVNSLLLFYAYLLVSASCTT
jgi:hypothetical protein